MQFILAVFLTLAGVTIACAGGLDEANAGLAAAQRGDYDEALRRFSAALAAGDLSAGNAVIAHHNIGNTYQDKGDYARAVTEYNIALQSMPGYAEAYYGRGRARFALGQFTLAAADFTQSMKLDPTDAYAVLWLHLTRRKSAASNTDELSRNLAKFDRVHWPGPLLELYLGQASPQQVRAASLQGDAKAKMDQACEAAFYVGEYELLRSNSGGAKSLFQEAVKICPYTADERDGAAVELKRMP